MNLTKTTYIMWPSSPYAHMHIMGRPALKSRPNPTRSNSSVRSKQGCHS